jgi:hypothetical protein
LPTDRTEETAALAALETLLSLDPSDNEASVEREKVRTALAT